MRKIRKNRRDRRKEVDLLWDSRTQPHIQPGERISLRGKEATVTTSKNNFHDSKNK